MKASSRLGAKGSDLARLWRDAAAFLPHLAGCTCTGPHLTLDRDAIEADLLAYLAQTYRDAGHAVLARFVAAREQANGNGISFAVWLAALDTASLDAADRRRLIDDLEPALQSLAAAKSGGFVCE
ncbi:MAG TPA: hypothetical protein VG271_01580 [Beijerinckiaceae bacterium]|nr:hypothetical protein [Beijerinckiaceae bacterium]